MAAAPRTARALARAELTRAILAQASRQLADVGPAALSVRQIARDLEMASSAVYRYFPSRDALLTALIVAAYDDAGAAVEAGDAIAARDDLGGRFRGATYALRSWAIAHPHDYALTYGSPVPGYSAPDDTVTAATRVPTVLLRLVADAARSGAAPAPTAALSETEAAGLVPIQDLLSADAALSDASLLRALMAWSTLFGHVSLELFGHMHRGILDYEAHFTQVVAQLAADLGLPVPHPPAS